MTDKFEDMLKWAMGHGYMTKQQVINLRSYWNTGEVSNGQ